MTANEPKSPAGVLTAVVFGVSYATELSLVVAIDTEEDVLLAPTWRLFADFGAIDGTVMLSKTRRELDRVALDDLVVVGFEDVLSERSSLSTSEELSTKLRDIAFLRSLLLGLRPSGVVVAINYTKVSKRV